MEVCTKLLLLCLRGPFGARNPVNDVDERVVMLSLTTQYIRKRLTRRRVKRKRLGRSELLPQSMLDVELFHFLIEAPGGVEVTLCFRLSGIATSQCCLAQKIMESEVRKKARSKLLVALLWLDRRWTYSVEHVEESHEHLTLELSGAVAGRLERDVRCAPPLFAGLGEPIFNCLLILLVTNVLLIWCSNLFANSSNFHGLGLVLGNAEAVQEEGADKYDRNANNPRPYLCVRNYGSALWARLCRCADFSPTLPTREHCHLNFPLRHTKAPNT